MRTLLLLPALLMVCGWAVWYNAPHDEHVEAFSQQQPATPSPAPSDGGSFYLHEEGMPVGSAQELFGIGLFMTGLAVAVCAGIVRFREKVEES